MATGDEDGDDGDERADEAFLLPAPANSQQKAGSRGMLLTKHLSRAVGSLLLAPPTLCLASLPRWDLAPPGATAGRGSRNRAGSEPLPSAVFVLFLSWLGPEAALGRAKRQRSVCALRGC